MFLEQNTLSQIFARWTQQRKAFGKPLHSQAVIRSKLAAMISRVESVQNWLENVTFQMNKMVSHVVYFGSTKGSDTYFIQSYKQQASKLAGWAIFFARSDTAHMLNTIITVPSDC